jgi:hypothetical protein
MGGIIIVSVVVLAVFICIFDMVHEYEKTKRRRERPQEKMK